MSEGFEKSSGKTGLKMQNSSCNIQKTKSQNRGNQDSNCRWPLTNWPTEVLANYFTNMSRKIFGQTDSILIHKNSHDLHQQMEVPKLCARVESAGKSKAIWIFLLSGSSSI